MCDKLIDEECTKLSIKLDLEQIQTEFEKNPDIIKDNHVVDTLFSILDFNKFKDMMIAFKLDNVNAKATVNNTVDSFSTYHADLMDDAYNLLKDEEDNKNWKVTHQDENRSI